MFHGSRNSSIHGTIFAYDKQFDGVNTRNEKPLEVKDMLRYNTTTSDDPVINEASILLLSTLDPKTDFLALSSYKRRKHRSTRLMPSCRYS